MKLRALIIAFVFFQLLVWCPGAQAPQAAVVAHGKRRRAQRAAQEITAEPEPRLAEEGYFQLDGMRVKAVSATKPQRRDFTVVVGWKNDARQFISAQGAMDKIRSPRLHLLFDPKNNFAGMCFYLTSSSEPHIFTAKFPAPPSELTPSVYVEQGPQKQMLRCTPFVRSCSTGAGRGGGWSVAFLGEKERNLADAQILNRKVQFICALDSDKREPQSLKIDNGKCEALGKKPSNSDAVWIKLSNEVKKPEAIVFCKEGKRDCRTYLPKPKLGTLDDSQRWRKSSCQPHSHIDRRHTDDTYPMPLLYCCCRPRRHRRKTFRVQARKWSDQIMELVRASVVR